MQFVLIVHPTSYHLLLVVSQWHSFNKASPLTTNWLKVKFNFSLQWHPQTHPVYTIMKHCLPFNTQAVSKSQATTCFHHVIPLVLFRIHLTIWPPRTSTHDSMSKRMDLNSAPNLMGCHFHLNSSPTSSNPLQQLLPGDDSAQPVPRPSAVMVHSQVDILSFRGHAAQILTACGLRRLPKHSCYTSPQTSLWCANV